MWRRERKMNKKQNLDISCEDIDILYKWEPQLMTIKCPKGQHEGFSKKLALSAILDNMKGWQCTCSENQTAAAFLALINTTMVLPAHVSVCAVRCIYLQTSMFHTRFTLPALQWRIAFLQSYIYSDELVSNLKREKIHCMPGLFHGRQKLIQTSE